MKCYSEIVLETLVSYDKFITVDNEDGQKFPPAKSYRQPPTKQKSATCTGMKNGRVDGEKMGDLLKACAVKTRAE